MKTKRWCHTKVQRVFLCTSIPFVGFPTRSGTKFIDFRSLKECISGDPEKLIRSFSHLSCDAVFGVSDLV